jgi:DNA-binding HxlR family transcriptional regulator
MDNVILTTPLTIAKYDEQRICTTTRVLKTIADDKSLIIFNTIALSSAGSDVFVNALGITRKQYYSRLSSLLKAGLVRREKGKYSLTTFGIILYYSQDMIGRAVDEYWKLKAIDTIRSLGNGELPPEQFHTIFDKLIANQEIKYILLKHFKSSIEVEEIKKSAFIDRGLYSTTS